ncbi:MAG: phosphatase PAP2 family protein [Bacteroidaceae bacterium]|nr:phosphatase PAP2 family protein [Bacteroidaceae bacterium]MBR1788781.1 phosphatase PAP2 family protein [Bacteroidaceae bacterium]
MIKDLINLDNRIFLQLNGSDSVFWDSYMWYVTQTVTWIPLLCVLLLIVVKNSQWQRTLLFVTGLGLTILLADRISSGLIKPMVHRWRPTHDVTFLHTIDTVFGYTGGRFGFVSSHAANTFALFTFVSMCLRNRLAALCLLLWAIVSSYSRVYLGVHYPGDILCGAILGVLVGFIVYALYNCASRHLALGRQYYSTAYTSSGFLISDMNMLAFALFATYSLLFIFSAIMALL